MSTEQEFQGWNVIGDSRTTFEEEPLGEKLLNDKLDKIIELLQKIAEHAHDHQ